MKQHVLEMIRQNTKRFGDKAVFQEFISEGKLEQWSWSQMYSMVQKASAALISKDAAPKSNIGIFSQNRHQWLISDLAIMQIGARTVPFYSTATAAQLEYIIGETEMEIIFCGDQAQAQIALSLLNKTSLKTIILFEENPAGLPEKVVRWKDFLEIPEEADFLKAENYFQKTQPDDLATIIYTSGTTGEPKGVMLDHNNFMDCFRMHDQRLTVQQEDLSMAFLPLSHIFERAWSLYMLYSGALIHFLPNPRAVIEEMKKVQPTLMCAVPRFFEKTLEGVHKEYDTWPAFKQKVFDFAVHTGKKMAYYRAKQKIAPLGLRMKEALSNKLVYKNIAAVFGGKIKYMPCAGAAMNPDDLLFFHAVRLFVNYGYGATETTATVSCFREDEYDFNSCGTVMPGLEVKIGENDEILIKGPMVFRGYYKKEEETARVLRDGWFYSGDEGKFVGKDKIMMTDRIKDLMKTSVGKYISPQKLEMLLGSDPYIEQVLVIADRRKYVSALIVPSFEKIKVFADAEGLIGNTMKELIQHQEIRALIEQRIMEQSKDLMPHEQIKRFELLCEAFSIEKGSMTNTLKIKRKPVMEMYRDRIEAMYM